MKIEEDLILNKQEIDTALHWRYATKKFDPTRKLSNEQVEAVLETLRLSASSMGLQPYEFIHVKDPMVREELQRHSANQSQITEASELIVFAAKDEISEEYVEYVVRLGAQLRGYNEEMVQRRIASTNRVVAKKGSGLIEWNARQAYIAMGQLLAVAALMKIDSCPMEGIETQAYDRILGLEPVNLTTLAAVTLGFRSESDTTARLPKVRVPKEKIIKTI